ncbi:MAG: hypothetical protein L3J08_00685 [Flavobacteriaceae bacterium]|nr:hypothetical protein [Flavobacteriaceae bacterium]
MAKIQNHGVYTMLISGEVSFFGKNLERRDTIGISETSDFTIKANQDSEILFIEVSMN